MTEQKAHTEQVHQPLEGRIETWKKGWQALDAKLPQKEAMGELVQEVGNSRVADLEKLVVPFTEMLAEIKALDAMLSSDEVKTSDPFFEAQDEVKSIMDRAWALEEILKSIFSIISTHKSLASPLNVV